MRYLIVCDYSLTYLGGAQVALVRQAEALASQGATVTVVAPDVSSIDFKGQVTTIEPPKVRRLPGAELPLFKKNAALLQFSADLLVTVKPDAILSHSEFGLVASLTQQAKVSNIPTIHTVHTFFWHSPRLTAPIAGVAKLFFKSLTGYEYPKRKLASNPLDNVLRNTTLAACLNADLTISPSSHQAEKLRAAGAKNVKVLSNVTESTGKPTAIPLAKNLKLAWIGRFSAEKRLDVALRAVELANLGLTLKSSCTSQVGRVVPAMSSSGMAD